MVLILQVLTRLLLKRQRQKSFSSISRKRLQRTLLLRSIERRMSTLLVTLLILGR